MCAPFYTSEKVQSDQPKWKELELGDEFGHNSGKSNDFYYKA